MRSPLSRKLICRQSRCQAPLTYATHPEDMIESPEVQATVPRVALPDIVDDGTVARLRGPLRRLASVGHSELHIDATQVVAITIRGLAMLAAVNQIGAATGTRVVVLPSPRVSELIHRFGLGRRITLDSSDIRTASTRC